MQRAGIYSIRHVLSGRKYIGQSTAINLRWEQHKEQLRAECHHNPRLQRLWNEDGEAVFEFETIAIAPAGLDPTQLQYWLFQQERINIDSAKQAGIALNIMRAELVETKAFLQHQREVADKKKSATTERIRSLRDEIKPLENKVRIISIQARQAEDELISATRLRKSASTRIAALFSSEVRQHAAELDAILEIKAACLESIRLSLESSENELSELKELRRKLYNSYPGNVQRHIRRNSFR